MKRWNIKTIFFLGVTGERREINFEVDQVNIVTGASGTGKSTLIKAVDYCLGSKNCELPAHVRRRCVAVGVKWVRGDQELIVGRVVPPVGQATSTRMFCTAGRNLKLPAKLEEFEGPAPVSAAKRFIESAFGIDDVTGSQDEFGEIKGRATVRHVTPYLFVTKEVIYSETILLHGLEDPEKARDIIASMPYFMGVVDQAAAVELQKLRQLERALEREEAKALARSREESSTKQNAFALLSEAHRLGIANAVDETSSETALISALRSVDEVGVPNASVVSEDELTILTDRRQTTLNILNDLRRQSRAAKLALRDANGAGDAITRQREKLQLADHLKLDDILTVCPICSSPSDKGKESAAALQSTLATIRAESAAVDRVRPIFVEHDRSVEASLATANTELRTIDAQISGIIRANESARSLATASQARAHALGKISFFLQLVDRVPVRAISNLDTLRESVEELRARVGREERETRLQIAESEVSGYASTAFSDLPSVDPCVGARLFFNSRKPDVSIIEQVTNAILRMTDVGSDQNYLAVHIALAFALQHHFEHVKAPVPGVLIFDQISRPYFPSKSENEYRDETEIVGGSEDEDIVAMRKHIDFLFKETARRNGLQVILIEHAYFADDQRYRDATRERWTRGSGKALIPLDWSLRTDAVTNRP
jgi:energy-coupling factor transporter ATP-binding protein EcfA2